MVETPKKVYCLGPILTPIVPQSRFGNKLLEISVVCPRNGTAVLKGLIDNGDGWVVIIYMLFVLILDSGSCNG